MRTLIRKIPKGIVTRLRITFYVIAGVLMAQMCIGIWQMRTLNTAVSDLTDQAVGTLLLTESSERDLKNLLLLLQKASTAPNADALPAINANLDRTMLDLRTTIDKMINTDITDEKSQQMATALADIETGVTAIIAARNDTTVRDQNLEKLSAELDEIHAKARATLEDLSFEAMTQSDSTFEKYIYNSDISAPLLYSEISENLAHSNTLTSLTLQMDATFDKANILFKITDAKTIEANQKALRADLRNLVILLGQMPESDTRRELARIVKDTRSLLFDSEKIVSEVAAKVEKQTNLSTFSANQNEPIAVISALSKQLNEQANAGVVTAHRDLSKATQSLVLTVSLTTLASLLAIAIASFYIVERQINTRMARLTKAVLSIADGNTDYQVNVRGPDELGKIGEALEVFKLNAKELNRSNEELEKFAYAAAHDLRSPLRAIQDLIEWTMDDTDNHFSSDGQQNMSLLQNRIHRLNRLLSDLLEYSRVGQEDADIAGLSLGSVTQEMSDFLDPKGHFNIKFVGYDGPVQTYTTPLRQILLNLISNSIKHHDKKTGEITINAYVFEHRIHIQVSDDGPGIPPSYHSRIFGMFETLRPRDEVEGSGLGLSIILKSIERYGGSITLDSSPETSRGSTFRFDFPEISSAAVALKTAA